MGEERKAVLLDGGREVTVVLAAGTAEFMAQALAGLPSRTGAATLRTTTNNAGDPLVAVLMGSKHMGFLPRAESQTLLPVIAAHDGAGADTRAKTVITLTPGDPSRGVMKVSLPEIAPSQAAAPVGAAVPAGGTAAFAAPVVVAARPTAAPLALAAPTVTVPEQWSPAPGPRGPMGSPAAQNVWARADAVDSAPPWASNASAQGLQRAASEAGQVSRQHRARGQSWLKRHPQIWKIGIAVAVAVACFLVVRTLVDSKWDNKEDFLWGELYYTEQVDDTDARRLGAYWEVTYQAGDAEFTLALDRKEGSFELSMILEDQDRLSPDVSEVMALLGEEMATLVFPGSSVSILVCDEHFDPYTAYGPYSGVALQ